MLGWLFQYYGKDETNHKTNDDTKDDRPYPVDPSSSSAVLNPVYNRCAVLLQNYNQINDLVNKMLDKSAFNEEYKFVKLIHKKENVEIWTILRKDNNQIQMCKVYNVNNANYKKCGHYFYDGTSHSPKCRDRC
eukprot:69430_1